MIDLSLMKKDGILIVAPTGALTDDDMEELRGTLSGMVADGEELKGLMIDANAFPGYADLQAFFSHMGIIRDFHGKIAKLALVSDAAFASAGEFFAKAVMGVDARHFPATGRDEALAWLRS